MASGVEEDYSQPILPGEGASDYERYLRTDELLALQKTPEEMQHRDELLFQTVHQSSELWLKLACFEVETATQLLREHDVPAALRLLRRANDCLKIAMQLLDMLEHMSPWEYQTIRKILGHGSGFDSPGFRNIRRVSPSLGEAFNALAPRAGSLARRPVRARPRARGAVPARRGAHRMGRARVGVAVPALQGRRARDRRRGGRHAGHARRAARRADQERSSTPSSGRCATT